MSEGFRGELHELEEQGLVEPLVRVDEIVMLLTEADEVRPVVVHTLAAVADVVHVLEGPAAPTTSSVSLDDGGPFPCVPLP